MVEGVETRLLVVDDDPQVGRFLSRYLEREGFDVAVALDGEAMRARMSEENFDLVILDLTMPGDDGLTLTRELRSQSNVGIIILTGKEGSVERVVGLELGADDYVSKPFDERELLARIRSVLRRSVTRHEPEAGEHALGFGTFRLQVSCRELAHVGGGVIQLTTMEFDLLAALVSNPQRVMSREELLGLAAGRSWSPYDRAIDTAIVKLRRKLGDDPKQPSIVKTVRGVGYVFALAVESLA